MSESRIAATFARLRQQNRVGLIAYLTVGFPDLQSTLDLVPAVAEGGADIIELGVPFSDPLADGATIQRAGFRALQQGVDMAACLETTRKLRASGVETPLVFMGYYNPFMAYGIERFAADAAAAGLDGVIVPDLPTEEAGPLWDACRSHGLDLTPLLAPTSNDARIEAACRKASGFVYCVSLTGVTGARSQVSSSAESLVAGVRKHTNLPVAVGFGISRREHVLEVGRYADAAVVGSALISVVEEAPPGQAATNARDFIRQLTGRDQPATTEAKA